MHDHVHPKPPTPAGPKPARRPNLTEDLALDIWATNWATAVSPFPGSPTPSPFPRPREGWTPYRAAFMTTDVKFCPQVAI